ncbi:MAG TPA: hypothetical protein VJ650_16190 [Gemmatimonadaceae bacterium]|nr:hypothetical protein [Gemmatimonadaceae bacterium]
MLRGVLLAAAIVLPVAVTIAAQFSSHPRGPLFIPLYVAPLVTAAPIWLRIRLAERPLALSAIWILDVLVLSLGALRALGTGWIPFSGHTLFLTYSPLVTRHRGYRVVALVLFLETTVFKLWVWRDPSTWALGIGVGLLLAAVASRLDREPAAGPGVAATGRDV